MARSLILSLDGHEFSVNLVKIDRESLYGDVEIEAFDEKGKPATIKILASDGKTLIDKGGTALSLVNEEGTSIERSALIAVDSEGEKIEPVESSFNQANILKRVDAEDYLSQIVKSVYLLQAEEAGSLDYLNDHLSSGGLYYFPFSYRGGLEYDSAFIVGGSDGAFMVVGKQAALQFVKLNETRVLDSPEENEISAEDLNFDLL